MKHFSVGVSSLFGIIAIAFFAIPVLAYASASVSIQDLSPSNNITVGQGVTFNITASGFLNPVYSVSDSLSGSSVSSTDIDSSGDFSWTPGNGDVGTHNLTITVSDTLGNSETSVETITVSAPASISLQSLSPGSNVTVGQTVSFVASVTGFTDPSYSVSDSFGGSSVSNADINSSGDFSWTPAGISQNGAHTITVYVTDSLGHTASATETINVQASPTLVIGTVSPSTAVAPGQTVTFTAAASNFSSPSFSLSDSFGGSSINNTDINSSGQFTWIPNASDDGTHTITVYVSDSLGHSATASQTIIVGGTPVNSGASIQGYTSGTSVLVGQPVSFTVNANGFTNPVFSVGDFSGGGGSTIGNADINSAGYFSWTPTSVDIGTHNLTIYMNDSYGHTGSITVSIPVGGPSVTIASATSSATALGQLEAQLQQDEVAIQAAGGTTGGPSTSYVFTENLSLGMSDAQVTQLQTVLQQKGYFSGTPTGYYGSLTEAAVMKFQAANGIEQVGSVGPATRAALNALMVTQSSSVSSSSSASTAVGDGYMFTNLIAYGDTSNDVTELQKRLTAFGVYSGPITGYFGSLTQAAVKTFQGQHGIAQVGYVGPSTRAALDQ